MKLSHNTHLVHDPAFMGGPAWYLIDRAHVGTTETHHVSGPCAGYMVHLPGEFSYWRTVEAWAEALMRHGIDTVSGSTLVRARQGVK